MTEEEIEEEKRVEIAASNQLLTDTFIQLVESTSLGKGCDYKAGVTYAEGKVIQTIRVSSDDMISGAALMGYMCEIYAHIMAGWLDSEIEMVNLSKDRNKHT